MENVWILLAIFVVLMMMHVPIAVAMGLSSLIGFMMIGYNLTTVGSLLYTAVASTSMITIPGYIFAGAIMAKGGISRHLLNALNAWIGHVPGGVAIATVLACAMFAAITGSASATIAAVGGLMIPAMIDSNYQKSFSMGLVASAAVIIILYLLNDTICSEDDVQKYLGLNTLGLIPIEEGAMEQMMKDKRKRKGHSGGLWNRLLLGNRSRKGNG